MQMQKGWFAYILYKLLKISRPGYAFRYGIPVRIIGWILVVTPSHMGMYPVIWLKSFEYPVSSLIALAIFIATLALVAQSDDRRIEQAQQ
jgi:hypothetical protein